MAKLLSKKFIGNNEVDGEKLLLEQGQSIKAKDAGGVEQDLIKFGPAGEVLVGADNSEVALNSALAQEISDRADADALKADKDLSNLAAGTADINIQTSANVNVTSPNINLNGTVYVPDHILFTSTDSQSVINGFDVFDYAGQASPAKTSDMVMFSGNVTDSALTTESVSSGQVFIGSGNIDHGAGASGPIALKSGNSATQSGDISLQTGSSAGIRGAVSVDAAHLNLNSTQIKNLANGSDAQDAVSKAQLDEKVAKAGDTMSGTLSFSGASTAVSAAFGDGVDIIESTVLSEDSIVINYQDTVNTETYTSQMNSGYLKLSSTLNGVYKEIEFNPANNSILAKDGGAPMLSLNPASLTTKKYVDDADAVLQDQIDAISGGGSGSLSALQDELDDTQVGAGLAVDGTYVVPSGSNYLGASSSLANADFLLDAQIKSAKDDIGLLESEDLTFLKLDGSRPMQANLNMMDGPTHYKIVGLADPVDGRDAVNKQYVDAIAEGLHVHAPAKVYVGASLASISGGTVTYANGSSGVGATLTLSVAISAIDGYSLQDGDRVIINGESAQSHNGIYIWAAGGTVFTRASDFDTTIEVAGGDFIFVQEGSQFGNSGWVMSETTTAIGTSPIVFIQFSGAGTYTAGDALSLTGGEFNTLYDNASIGVNGSNQLFVKTNGIASGMIQADAVDKSKIASDVAGIGLEQAVDGSLEIKLDGSSLSKSASGLKSNIVWSKKYFDLTSTDITNGYVELDAGVIAEAGSIIGFVDRLAIHEGEDFIVSTVSGKTRISFAGDLVSPGQSQLDATDNLYFKFQKKAV